MSDPVVHVDVDMQETLKKIQKSQNAIQASLSEMKDLNSSVMKSPGKRPSSAPRQRVSSSEGRRPSSAMKRPGSAVHMKRPGSASQKSVVKRPASAPRKRDEFVPSYMASTYSSTKHGSYVRSRPRSIKAGKSKYPPPGKFVQKPPRDKMDTPLKWKTIHDIHLVLGLGTLSLPNYGLTSLEGLRMQRDLKIFFLQNNFLTSFKYLESQPNMELLHCPDNCFASFCGLQSQPKLKSINLVGNPIAKHPHFRLMCLMCVGTQLKRINHDQVTFNERQFVRHYLNKNPLAVEAIRLGWLMDMGVKKETDFLEIIHHFQNLDMDDRETIKQSQQYIDLLEGKCSIFPLTGKFDGNYQELFKQEQSEISNQKINIPAVKSSPKSKKLNNSFVSPKRKDTPKKSGYKLKLAAKNEELRELKQRIKFLESRSVSAEQLFLMHSIHYVGFQYECSEVSESTKVELLLNLSQIDIKDSDKILRTVTYDQISKTSLLLDPSDKYKLHIELHDANSVDFLTEKKKIGMGIYKVLHLFILEYKRQRKLQKMRKSEEQMRKLEKVQIINAKSQNLERFNQNTRENQNVSIRQNVTKSEDLGDESVPEVNKSQVEKNLTPPVESEKCATEKSKLEQPVSNGVERKQVRKQRDESVESPDEFKSVAEHGESIQPISEPKASKQIQNSQVEEAVPVAHHAGESIEEKSEPKKPQVDTESKVDPESEVNSESKDTVFSDSKGNVDCESEVNSESKDNFASVNQDNVDSESKDNDSETKDNVASDNQDNVASDVHDNADSDNQDNVASDNQENVDSESKDNDSDNQDNVDSETKDNVDSESKDNDSESKDNVDSDNQDNVASDVHDNADSDNQDNVASDNQENVDSESKDNDDNVEQENTNSIDENSFDDGKPTEDKKSMTPPIKTTVDSETVMEDPSEIQPKVEFSAELESNKEQGTNSVTPQVHSNDVSEISTKTESVTEPKKSQGEEILTPPVESAIEESEGEKTELVANEVDPDKVDSDPKVDSVSKQASEVDSD